MTETIPAEVIEKMADQVGPRGYSQKDEDGTSMKCVRAALKAAEAMGWVMVPTEATEAMFNGARDALRNRVNELPPEQRPWFQRPNGSGYHFGPREKASLRYRAMIAARPKVP